jgi:hypothetical protein
MSDTHQKGVLTSDNTMRLEGRLVPVFAGTRLIAACTHKSFVNGALLEFRGRCGKHFTLFDQDVKKEFQATRAQIEKCCRLAWALTINSAQSKDASGRRSAGGSEPAKLHARPSLRGVSRVTDPALLECAE